MSDLKDIGDEQRVGQSRWIGSYSAQKFDGKKLSKAREAGCLRGVLYEDRV